MRDPKELSVLLLARKEAYPAGAFANLPLKSIRFLSPAEAALQLGLGFAPENNDACADLLYAAHLLSRLRPRLPLMLPDMREIRLTQGIQKWGMRAACASWLAIGLLTLCRAGDLAATLYQTQKIAIQLAETRIVLERAQAHAAPLTEPLGRMRQALERRHIYEQLSPTPWRGLNQLASGLNQESKIVRLEWKKDGDAEPENLSIVLRMTGDEVSGDRAETVASFSRIAQNIAQAMPDYSVKNTKPPYPALPQDSVSANTSAEDPVGEIVLERKIP